MRKDHPCALSRLMRNSELGGKEEYSVPFFFSSRRRHTRFDCDWSSDVCLPIYEVYFGITCFDSDPKRIVATELRRDVSQELDDYFEIIIDSAHDRRNAYVFQINPLGTQRDALITEEQRTDSSTGDGDPGWDGVWTSEARRTAQGWTANIAIPFSTLNFMQSSDVIWGINFKRFIRRKNEEDLWSAWRRVDGASLVSC